MYRLAVGLALLGLVVGLARPAAADRRSFTNTYEYTTVPEGRTALELWHTESRDTWQASTPQRFQEIIEVEHGLTDHWDAAFYTTFGQVSAKDPMTAEAMHLSDVRLETRYRLADRGEWPVDTLLYFEASKAFGASAYEFEGKTSRIPRSSSPGRSGRATSRTPRSGSAPRPGGSTRTAPARRGPVRRSTWHRRRVSGSPSPPASASPMRLTGSSAAPSWGSSYEVHRDRGLCARRLSGLTAERDRR